MTVRCVVVGLIGVFVVTATSAQDLRSAGFETSMEQLANVKREGVAPPESGANLLNSIANPGFETGNLAHWTTSNWVVTTSDPLRGSYCAKTVGNVFIEQFFDPVDVNDVTATMVWMRQPDAALSAISLYYGPTDHDEVIYYPGADWTLIDMTPNLRASGFLTGVRVYGYSGGGSQETYIDNIMVLSGRTVAFPLANDNWEVSAHPNWWHDGDTVYGIRNPPVGAVTHADIALKLSGNLLHSAAGGFIDFDFEINGTPVGYFLITEQDGRGYLFKSINFAAVTPPFELRFTEVNTVVPGAGSITLDDVGESWVTFSTSSASIFVFYDGFESGGTSNWAITVP